MVDLMVLMRFSSLVLAVFRIRLVLRRISSCSSLMFSVGVGMKLSPLSSSAIAPGGTSPHFLENLFLTKIPLHIHRA